MASFDDNLSPDQSVGNIRDESCQNAIMGIPTGPEPSEVIKVAQKKYDIDFILNPHFTYSGKCIYVSDDGAKIK